MKDLYVNNSTGNCQPKLHIPMLKHPAQYYFLISLRAANSFSNWVYSTTPVFDINTSTIITQTE